MRSPRLLRLDRPHEHAPLLNDLDAQRVELVDLARLLVHASLLMREGPSLGDRGREDVSKL